MPDTSNVILKISPDQVFKLASQLSSKDKVELFHLLEQEQYADNIPQEHKQLVEKRINRYDKNAELLIDETEALKRINSM